MGERIDTGGLQSALRLLGAVGGLQDGTGGQADMFAGFESTNAPLPLPVKGVSGPQGGRPAGAVNRSTEAWAEFYLSQNRAPLSVLGNISSQNVGELHDALQAMADKHTRKKIHADGTVEEVRVLVDPLAVLKLVRDTAVAAARYIHKEQPKAIEIEQRQLGVVLLGDLPAGTGDALTGHGGGNDDLALPELQSVEYQEVTSAPPAQSDAPQSDKPANPLIFRDDAS